MIVASPATAPVRRPRKLGRFSKNQPVRSQAIAAKDAATSVFRNATAVVASIPFAPEVAIPAVLEMNRRYGRYIYSTYGFLDAFNLSFDATTPLNHGHAVPGFGWVDGDYIGIDQGAICAMIENYRSDLIWRVMQKSAPLRRGLERAGFTGGWLATAQ